MRPSLSRRLFTRVFIVMVLTLFTVVPTSAFDVAAIFFEYAAFNGAGLTKYDLPFGTSGNFSGTWNDRVSSMSISPGWSAELFEHASHEGKRLMFIGHVYDLNWFSPILGEDVASSYRLHNYAEHGHATPEHFAVIFKLANYDLNGGGLVLDPTNDSSYPNLPGYYDFDSSFGPRSLKVGLGYEVTLYVNPFTHQTFSADVPDLSAIPGPCGDGSWFDCAQGASVEQLF